MIRVKDDTVNLSSLSPAMLLGLIVIDQVYTEYGKECVVTSANDGRHSETSLHYNGEALDIRTRDFGLPERALIAAVNEIKYRLGWNYDVILENDHLHVEHQPRRPNSPINTGDR